MRELRGLGHRVVITGRRFIDTVPVARSRGVPVRLIGTGYDIGRSIVIKRCFHLARSQQLVWFAQRQAFDVAVSHCSRTQATAAARLGIPTLATTDYEHGYLRDFRRVRRFMAPRVIPATVLEARGVPREAVQPYDGLKEHVYLTDFEPRVDVRQRVGVSKDDVLVTFRPFSENAHYGKDDGFAVERQLLERLSVQNGIRILALPRTERQRRRLRAMYGDRVATHPWGEVVDGPSLILASDLVVSGGGTMIREAAVLGVPAISCFTGPLGAVDQHLARVGRIALVRSVADAARVEGVERWPRRSPDANPMPRRQLVRAIVETADIAS